MADKRLYKEFKQLKLSHPQIKYLAPEEDSLFDWKAIIINQTSNSPYYLGKWDLSIKIPSNYPSSPPKIKFMTPIIHPNINLKGDICLDILDKSWSPAWNIYNAIVAIVLLLDTPEPDSPLNLDASILFRVDKLAYTSLCQYYIWKNGQMVTEKTKSGIKPEITNNNENEINHENDLENNTINNDNTKDFKFKLNKSKMTLSKN